MNNFRFLVCSVALLSAISAGCAKNLALPSESEKWVSTPKLPDDYFDAKNRCMEDWDVLIQEWKTAGGGIKNSIAETREAIEKDRKSRFARIVRRSWHSEKQIAERSADFATWPIADSREMAMSRGIAILKGDGISENCESTTWLIPAFWDQLRVVHSDGSVTIRTLADAPSALSWESPQASKWIFYWLFTKLN